MESLYHLPIYPLHAHTRTRAHSQADRARYSLSVRPSGAGTRSPQGRQLNGKLGIKWKKSKYKSEPLRTQWKPLSLSWPPNSPKWAPCRGLGGLRQGAKRVPGPGSEEPGRVAAGVAAASQTRNKVRDHQSAWPDLLRRKAAPHREVAGARRPSCPVPCSAGRAPATSASPAHSHLTASDRPWTLPRPLAVIISVSWAPGALPQ